MKLNPSLLTGSAVKGNEYLHSMLERSIAQKAMAAVAAQVADVLGGRAADVQRSLRDLAVALQKGEASDLVDRFYTEYGGTRLFSQHVSTMVQSDMTLVGSALFADNAPVVDFSYDSPQTHDLVRAALQLACKGLFTHVGLLRSRRGKDWHAHLDAPSVDVTPQVSKLLYSLVDMHGLELPGETRSRVAGPARKPEPPKVEGDEGEASKAGARGNLDMVVVPGDGEEGKVSDVEADDDGEDSDSVHAALDEVRERQRLAAELAKSVVAAADDEEKDEEETPSSETQTQGPAEAPEPDAAADDEEKDQEAVTAVVPETAA